MLDALGLEDRTMFSHFRIPEKSLDDGLVPLMSGEDVVQCLNTCLVLRKQRLY